MDRFQFTSNRMLSAIAWFAIALALLMFRLRERQHYPFVGPFDLLGAVSAAGGAIGAMAGNAMRGAHRTGLRAILPGSAQLSSGGQETQLIYSLPLPG